MTKELHVTTKHPGLNAPIVVAMATAALFENKLNHLRTVVV